ncbi:DUF6452 family protein [Geofilum rubicundum]|uniref:Lipoprotein n=1 Tax=Geofilum rubicundum JCM 15548 TaxID=1236989 RepID=A0A0E9LVM6_9BACT|nr:DUF6452 family protein [Geofilum rubicundum]GAO29309.1 hypothetical protein JCM15548_11483 [Geofilum rubicundum JCM 15548]
MKCFKIFLYIVVALLWLLPASCTQDQICLSNQHAVQTGFYSGRSSVDKDTMLQNSSVFGVHPQRDSIYATETFQTMFLPLSFDQDTTIFVIDNNSLRDTLWFSHSKEMAYISRECGFTFNFTIDSVWFTRVFVDSVAIDVKEVNYSENFENVKIYIY